MKRLVLITIFLTAALTACAPFRRDCFGKDLDGKTGLVTAPTNSLPWEEWVKEQAETMARKQQMQILSAYTAAKLDLDVEMTRLYIKWYTEGPSKKLLNYVNNAESAANKAWWKCLAAKRPREECDALFKLSADLDDFWLMIKQAEE